jgi:tetratricopeptide (TPR) repeat protein
MMEAVHRYEGTVNQVMGDGIMALFGAPLAHEDHAVRACYAALRMQDSIKRYAEEVQRVAGVPIQIRVGLNSGEVLVRSVGSDLRMDYTAVGQTTHLAARMEQTAMPGRGSAHSIYSVEANESRRLPIISTARFPWRSRTATSCSTRESRRRLSASWKEAIELQESAGAFVDRAWWVRTLGEIYRRAGQLDDADRTARTALEFARRHGEMGNEAWIHALFGSIASDRGEAATARRHFEEARTLADTLGMRPLGASCQVGLGVSR